MMPCARAPVLTMMLLVVAVCTSGCPGGSGRGGTTTARRSPTSNPTDASPARRERGTTFEDAGAGESAARRTAARDDPGSGVQGPRLEQRPEAMQSFQQLQEMFTAAQRACQAFQESRTRQARTAALNAIGNAEELADQAVSQHGEIEEIEEYRARLAQLRSDVNAVHIQ